MLSRSDRDEPESPPERRAAQSHVLVVEDDDVIRASLGELLEDSGYQVSFAENGQVALQVLTAGRAPDVIVLDLKMPVMDGWQFRAIQKDDPRLGLIPVVAISADRSAAAAPISAQATCTSRWTRRSSCERWRARGALPTLPRIAAPLS